MIRRGLTICLLFLAASTAAQAYAPKYEASDCPYSLRRMAAETGADISCGYLTVSEVLNRATGNRHIELFVMRIAARQPAGNTPVIFLAGGPGSAVADHADAILESPLHQHYEFIGIDQRGAGFSRPSLNCQEDDQIGIPEIERIQKCYRRLLDEGFVLDAYNSANIANDIHDLLLTLNIDSANVYGVSYGSRLALTLARDFPHRLRSLILDAVLPLQVNRLNSYSSNAYRAMQQLLEDCAADQDCDRAYPSLRESLVLAIENFFREPALAIREDTGDQLVLGGATFASDIVGRLGRAQDIPQLPEFIASAAQGEYVLETDRPAKVDYDNFSEGAWLSIHCADEAPFNSRDAIVARAAAIPRSLKRALVATALDHLAYCAAWKARPASSIENQPVVSDIPTLLLSGAYDPLTPSTWGAEAAVHLSRSWHFVFPAGGHGMLFADECADAIALAFLANPSRTPDAACLSQLSPPRFTVRK